MPAEFLNDAALQIVLQELELDRKKTLSKRLEAFAVIAAGAAILIIGFLFNFILLHPLAYVIIALAVMILGGVFYSNSHKKFQVYRNAFKKKVIGAALSSIDQSLVIEPEYGIGEQEFIDSQLFTRDPDRYSTEDFVSGKAGNTDFYFAEVNAEYKTVTTDNKGRRTETWHEILKGIIFTADFNKNFQGVTVIRPKDIGSRLGSWIAKAVPIFSSHNQLVELENLEFDKTFITHSTDQVEARYILTPAMMDKLCQLNSKSNYTISLSFIGTRVYIAFPLREDYFEPPLFKSILSPSFLERDVNLVRFMYDIIKELDLNTRIWGKN